MNSNPEVEKTTRELGRHKVRGLRLGADMVVRGCLKTQAKRRVGARGLQQTGGNSLPCRPGPLTGRVFEQALKLFFLWLLVGGIFVVPCRSATVRWVGGSGEWGDTTKWSGGARPGQNDDVVIDASHGAITVTIASRTVQVKSLLSEETLLLNGGTIKGGTITTTNGAALVVQSGTLDGVTVNGVLDVGSNVSGARLAVVNGLVLNGTAYVGGTNGTWGMIGFAGNQVLGGNGTVVFGSQADTRFNALRVADSGTTLVIGSGITVRGQNGTVGSSRDVYGGSSDVSVVNQGTILADVGGGTIVIAGGTFNNAGVLEAKNGGMIQLASSVTQNSGRISVDSGDMKFTGGFNQTGGELDFGLGSSTDFGHMTFSAAATIGGTLGAHLLGAYSPKIGDSFPVLNYGTNRVTFTNVSLPKSNVWQTNYSKGVLVLVVKDVLPLSVVISPTNQTVPVGSTVVLHGTATGPGITSYQWKLNGTGLAGATNTDLVLSNLSKTASGAYTVVVSTHGGSLTSDPVQLTVLTPPAITIPPQSQTAEVGETVTFAASVTGDAPLSYQWLFNGSAIEGGTSSSLVLSNLLRAQAGRYSVVISNPVGAATSAPPATLTVETKVACPGAPDGMVAWWRGEGNPSDYAGTNDAVFEGVSGYAAGEVGQASAFDGSTSYLAVANSPLWALGTNDFSIEFWANFASVVPSDMGGDGSMVFIAHNEGSGAKNKWLFGFGGQRLYFYVRSSTLTPLFLAQAAFDPVTNRWYHLGLTKASGVYRTYVNGAQVSAETNNLPVPVANAPLTIGQAQGLFMDGLLDEISLYNRALGAGEIQAIYQAGAQGKCGLGSGSAIGLQAQVGDDGKVTIQIAGGQAGATLTVEATEDFKQWVTVGSIVKSRDVENFIDPTPILPRWRYYRVVHNP